MPVWPLRGIKPMLGLYGCNLLVRNGVDAWQMCEMYNSADESDNTDGRYSNICTIFVYANNKHY